MDISTGNRTSLEIFRLIVEAGPQTLYSVSTQSQFPLGTVHRHFKEMEESEKIAFYDSKIKGRKN